MVTEAADAEKQVSCIDSASSGRFADETSSNVEYREVRIRGFFFGW
jgi:hypothetical protein